jgi:S1-C subfamily serine protease
MMRVAVAATVLALALGCVAPVRAADVVDTIARVKRSIVAIGTYEPGRSPAFRFRGTGFAVGDGRAIATNAHVLPSDVDLQRREALAVLTLPTNGEPARVREARTLAVDPGSDLALLALTGAPLPPLVLRDSKGVHEGQEILMTGFPIGSVLGPYAATHRGMIAAITPIAIPQANSAALNPALVHRLNSGSFPVFQLDATAYPGNSGSPIYDPDTGEVLGVVNMVFVKRTKESALTDPSGITYAVPSAHLAALLRAQSGKADTK